MRGQESIDIELWKKRFPLDSFPGGGTHITSPMHLSLIEQIRDRRHSQLQGVTRVATDVFLFGKGESSCRTDTKIGGTPYWPTKKPWPLGKDQRPLTFVAQFNFSESRDICGPVPGDILAFFCGKEWYDDFHCEWLTLGSDSFVSSEEVPEPAWKFVNAYCSKHRTVDFEGADEVFHDCPGPSYLEVLQGMKIGGIPPWTQGVMDVRGRFLCCLPSIQAAPLCDWPWLNQKLALTIDEINFPENCLMWLDMGVVYFFGQEDGTLLIEWQS